MLLIFTQYHSCFWNISSSFSLDYLLLLLCNLFFSVFSDLISCPESVSTLLHRTGCLIGNVLYSIYSTNWNILHIYPFEMYRNFLIYLLTIPDPKLVIKIYTLLFTLLQLWTNTWLMDDSEYLKVIYWLLFPRLNPQIQF